MVHETSIYAPLYLATKKGKNSTSEEFCLTPLLESQAKRSQETKKVIAREVNYFQEHRDHLHYRQMEKAEAPLGSGAVESLGKQLQRRLRSCGQFWSRPGLTHLLSLSVLVKNRDLPLLWN